MTVHLLTIGPGDGIERIWGHNALLVRDTAAAVEEVYNYGLFDPTAPGFYTDYFMGRNNYLVAVDDLDTMLSGYRADGRRVWAQELALPAAAKVELLRLLQTAAAPRNRFYRYDYFLDNCSTKLRDVLDVVLDGQLGAATEEAASGASWRHHTRRLTAPDPLLYLGIHFIMGPRGDDPTTLWQDMWAPMKLRDTVGALMVDASDGSRTPLVLSEELWEDAAREYPPVRPPSLDSLFLLTGLLTGVVLSLLGYGARARRSLPRAALIAFACVWGLFCLAGSALLVALHWTDHPVTHWNQNLLLFNPLGPFVAVSLIRMTKKGTTSIWGRRFVLGSLLVAAAAVLLHVIPATAQGNRELIAFALPVHLGLCWLMLGVNRMDHALVYG